MLYLFGRLALSDSYYFNQDFQADEHPKNQPQNQRCPAPEPDARPAATPLNTLADVNLTRPQEKARR